MFSGTGVGEDALFSLLDENSFSDKEIIMGFDLYLAIGMERLWNLRGGERLSLTLNKVWGYSHFWGISRSELNR